MLNDDCLGRTLDWLYAHDPTKLFAGIASRAGQIFGIKAQQILVDTTSFSVSGQYAVADSGVYSMSNMRQLNEAGVKWVSRVPETSQEAKAVLQAGGEQWQATEDGSTQWYSRAMSLPQGAEHWLIVRTQASQQRAQVSLQRQVTTAQASWERKCWHLSNRHFACEANARAALERELKGIPTWLEVRSDVVAHPRYAGKGRPRKEASPTAHQWQIVATVTVHQQRLDEEVSRKACFIVGSNQLKSEALSDQAVLTTYKEQGGGKRGFRFLKDPLFLASSVFVKKPERIIALSLIMVLCGARSIS